MSGVGASADEADHGGAATAVVGVHAEAHHAGGGVVFEAHGALTPRAADNVKGHGRRHRLGGRVVGDILGAAGGLGLDLDRGRAHGDRWTLPRSRRIGEQAEITSEVRMERKRSGGGLVGGWWLNGERGGRMRPMRPRGASLV